MRRHQVGIRKRGKLLKQGSLACRDVEPGLDADVLEAFLRGVAALRRSDDEADLQQERLNNVFKGLLVFVNGRGQRLNTSRPALVVLLEGRQVQAVEPVEAKRVDTFDLQCFGGNGLVDRPGVPDLRKIPYPA